MPGICAARVGNDARYRRADLLFLQSGLCERVPEAVGGSTAGIAIIGEFLFFIELQCDLALVG